MKEKNNFTHVLKYLRDHDMIRNQKDLAKRLNTTETTITRNKRGNVKHLDEETLHRFSLAFGDVINIAYLRGESNIMLVADLQQGKKTEMDVNPCKKRCQENCHSLIRATLAAKDDAIMVLKDEISVKDDVIAAKDALISSLQEQILELQTLLKEVDTHGYCPAETTEGKPGEHNIV